MITVTGMDLNATPAVPERALIVTAHPDDVDFGAAGTVARLTAAGTHVEYCIVTDGDAGEAPEGVARPDVGALRQAEQRAAAAAVGVTEVRFLGYPDGRLEVTLDLRRDLSQVIREAAPDVVICQSPERRWDRVFASHPDHLAAGEAALQAVYPDARNPYAHPELVEAGHAPHTVKEVWVMAHPRANRYVDITDTYEAKLAALRAHESQTSHVDLDALIGGWSTGTAREGGLDEGRRAEAFFTCLTG